MADGDVHTVFRDSRWRNDVEGSNRFGKWSANKAVAVSIGRGMARRRHVDHLVYLSDGRLDYTRTYRNSEAQSIRG